MTSFRHYKKAIDLLMILLNGVGDRLCSLLLKFIKMLRHLTREPFEEVCRSTVQLDSEE